MKTLQYAGFTPSESYSAIKDISKKHPEKILILKDRFVREFSKKADMESAEKVWRIIEDATSYLFNSSHAVCVALDSLYAAYLKAHHPYEFYITILQIYGEKGNKKRLALIKEEMSKGFGITIAPCHFRQDNRSYFIDKEAKTISDALTSIKGMSKSTASALYNMRDGQFDTFVDLLLALESTPNMNRGKTKTLIRLGYFKEFGGNKKLLKIFDMFTEGPIRYDKAHVLKTRESRIVLLKEYENNLDEEGIDFADQIKAEIEYCGTPLSVFPEAAAYFAVISVDEKYSPKIKLYNIQKGTSGEMKMRKRSFTARPLQSGDIITFSRMDWETKPRYQYINGKQRPIPGTSELWLACYDKIA